MYGDDAAREVAGPVVFFLGSICLALYATAATIIRQLIHKFHPTLKYIIPGFGYLVALITLIMGIWIFSTGGNSNFIVSGHVVSGIGLITACVATAATSSTKFYLIPVNSGSAEQTINREGFSALTEKVLIGLTILFSLVAWIWAIILLSRGEVGTYYFVAGSVMGGPGLYLYQPDCFGSEYFPADPERLYGARSQELAETGVVYGKRLCDLGVADHFFNDRAGCQYDGIYSDRFGIGVL